MPKNKGIGKAIDSKENIMRLHPRRKIGEILIEDGLLTPEQLDEALEHQKTHGGLLGQILIEKEFVSEDHLISALGKQLKMPFLPLKNYSINPDMAGLLEADFCYKNFVVPFDGDGKKVYLAVADPLNEELIEKIATMTHRIPKVFLARNADILNALYFLYHQPT